MSSVYVCELDGQMIPAGKPYVSIQDVQEHRPTEDGMVVTVKTRASGYLTFHDGLCAAGWLGKLGVGAP